MLLKALLLLLTLNCCKAVDYYVITKQQTNSTCPAENCHTLEYYTNAGANLLRNHKKVHLFFLQGTHTSYYQLRIKNTEEVFISGYLQRAELSGVEANFWNITHFNINNLVIIGGTNNFEVFAESVSISSLVLLFKTISVRGYKMNFTGNVFTYSSVEICTDHLSPWRVGFVLFEQTTLRGSNVTDGKNMCGSQRLDLVFRNCSTVSLQWPRTSKTNFLEFFLKGYYKLAITIENSIINGQLAFFMIERHNELNISISNSYYEHEWELIRFIYSAAMNSSVMISFNNLKMENKHANNDGAIISFGKDDLRLVYCCDFQVAVKNSTIFRQNTVLSFPFEPTGYFDDENINLKSMTCRSSYAVTIVGSEFIENFKCLYVSLPSDLNIDLNITITQSEFKGNQQVLEIERVYRGFTFNDPLEASSSVLMSLEGTKFIGNSIEQNFAGIINCVEIETVLISTCQFIENTGTAIVIVSSNILFQGHNIFINNSGDKGGAIALYYTTIYMANYSTLLFSGNKAKFVGGAIYVEEKGKSSFKCFAKPATNDMPLFMLWKIRIEFISNYAVKGGDNVYGTGLRRKCDIKSTRILMYYFRFIFKNVSLSSVTSNPTRVCLCDSDGIPQCLNMTYIYKSLPPRYPGEQFTVPVVLVGNDLGTVQGVAYTSLQHDKPTNSGNTDILESQYSQAILNHRKCSDLNITIQSNEGRKTQTIQITAGQTVPSISKQDLLKPIERATSRFGAIEEDIQRLPVTLKVPMEVCPPGFYLTSTQPHICTCHYELVKIGLTCIIANHTGLVYRSGTYWINSFNSGNDSSLFVIHWYCPYGYCKPDNISVDLRFSNSQCALNHSGVLCGGCQDNHSLALGSSRCLPCNNRNISLLIVFILAGFILVLFIKALDLTVARGTINGLIFFANIVWTNKSILFPTPEPSIFVFHILQTFIAWLNLDLGIETCFFDGLDAYWKTWMQFLFPIYVWAITGLIILVSRYSTRASKLFGNNSVPVLATLILLSYSKLLRTIITAFGFSILEYPNSTQVVWSFDGNIAYFGAPHAILFLTSLTALLLLWLPFTSVLLTYQCLRRKSHLRPLHWVNRWRPFFDAYLGQLKPKQQYWVGLLLVVRALLLVMFAVTSAVIPRINILAIAVVGMSLFTYSLVFGMAYKSVWLSLLEMSFIMNVTLLAILKPYTQSSSSTDIGVTYTAIGITFLQFITIAIHRFFCQIKHTYTTYKRRHTNNTDQPPTREMRIVPQIVQMHYREPLLESGN